MKKEQETKAFFPEKEISEAQELINFVDNFIENHGRSPQPQELSWENDIIVYYFGSFENLLQIAWLGEPPPLRRDKKKRYCRYDNKLLSQVRWFFCDDNCERRFAERDDKALAEASEEIKRLAEKPRRRIWYKCRECGENCKIYLPIPLKEPKAKIMCRADPNYERLSKIYTYPFKKK